MDTGPTEHVDEPAELSTDSDRFDSNPRGQCTVKFMKELAPASQALLRDQGGVIASWQLNREERRVAATLAKTKLWQRITTRVFLASPAAASAEQRACISVLQCGPKAYLAGRNALVLHGWNDSLGSPFDVVVPVNHKPTSLPKWIQARRVAIQSGVSGPLPRVGVHDAAVQAAAWATTDRRALYILLSSLQQGLVSSTRLLTVARDRTRLRRRGLIMDSVREYEGGAESLSELDLGAICRKYGLPEPIRQVSVLDGHGKPRRIDADFKGVNGRTARVEVEGLHHLKPEVWFADVKRHNGLVLSGNGAYYRYSSWEIRYEPADFVRDMKAALLGETAHDSSAGTVAL